MHFKTILASQKSKIFSVGHGGRHFFTLKLAELTYSFWVRPWIWVCGVFHPLSRLYFEEAVRLKDYYQQTNKSCS